MKTYKVESIRQLVNVMYVEAESKADAEDRVEEMIRNGEGMEWDDVTGEVTCTAKELQKITLITKQERETTWYDIERNKDKLNIGDEIEVTLKNGTTADVVVAAIDPYKKNQVAFVFKNCVGRKHSMNDEATSRGGWRDCKMREYVNTDIYALLPDDLKAVIKPRTIRQCIDDNIYSSFDKLWLLSDTEVFNSGLDMDYEDVQFQLFEDPKNRIKFDEDDYPSYWWLRSANDTYNFHRVGTNGDWYNGGASGSIGVALGFMI